MMSGVPPIEPQVTIDLDIGSTSIYCTVEATLSLSLSFLGKGFLWHGGALAVDWLYNKLKDNMGTISKCFISYII
jgi:hypothetical protein